MGSRARHFGWILLLLLVGLCVRLFYMQVVHGEQYRRRANERMQLERTLEPKRGEILDRDGKPLVRNALTYDLLVIPTQLARHPQVIPRAAAVLGRAPAALAAEYQDVREEALRWMESDLERRFRNTSERRQRRARRSLTRYFLGRAYVLVSDIRDMAVVQEFYVEHRRYPGLIVRARPVRRYDHGELASHVIGRMGRIQAEEFSRLRGVGYDQNDWLGRAGLEKQYEKVLKGARGVEVRGRRVKGGKPEILFREAPVNGQALTLTLSTRLQRVAEEALDKRLAELKEQFEAEGQPAPPGGSVVLLDVETGGVLAMATAPRYDPGRFRESFAELMKDPRKPLFNRPMGGTRVPPPGSVFKIVSAIAALESGKIGPGWGCNCHGYLYEPGKFRCWKSSGHGPVDLADAIEQSCNVFFYRAGEMVGPEALADWGRKFGFGQPTGIELGGESKGTMPEPAWKQFSGRGAWHKADTRFVAIGQGLLETTPLQVARFMCGVATRGRLPQVRLLARTPIKTRQIAVSPGTWRAVIGGMRRVVHGGRGTASKYGLQKFDFAGKTGTAEVGGKRETHAWIAGFAPAAQPRVALVVMIEHAGHGGEVTGEVARKVLSAVFDPPEEEKK